MSIFIEKRDGSMELLDPDKYHSHVEHAVEGIEGVSISEIEMNAAIQIVNGSKSEDIQNALINSTADGIYENPKLDKVASRLLNQDLRKKVYGEYTPTDTLEIVMKNCEDGVYDKDYLLDNYTDDELKDLLSYIDYDKDDNFSYGGLKKNMDSYLIKQFDKIRETPQELYMMLNMFAFAKYKDKYNAEFRKKWILIGYECMSEFYASLPTPIIKQLRTTFKRFISCVLIPLGDTKHTIANANRAILILVAGGCGIGIGASDIRGLNAYIDNGRMKHEGILPILKGVEKTTKAFTQPDRDGSSTEFFPFFHVEVENFLVLGNAKGTDDVRVRDMDHAIMFNDYFFERYYEDKDITLFYMNDVPDIMSYIGDYDEFKKRYEYAEANVPEDRQTKVPAKLIFDTFISERVLTSREYTAFMDNIQEQGSYDVPIKESNLCLEICQPNFPLYDTINIKRNIIFNTIEDRNKYYELRKEAYFNQDSSKIKYYQDLLSECYSFVSDDLDAVVDETKDYDYFNLSGKPNLSEIGVCIIAGINLGMTPVEKLPMVSEYLVRLEDELIDYMTYDLPEVEKAAKMRRGIGIGFSDVFHLLAKNKVMYDTKEGRQLLHDRVEICAYHMTRTSIELAKDFGPCQLVTDTKYHRGIMPIDTYRKTVDELVDVKSSMDWEGLREDLLKYGIRHSTLMANAPFGSSSIPSNSTPGIEPPRYLIAKKDGLPKIVPEYEEYKDYYTLVWDDHFNNIDYFKLVAVAQKWMDQAMSINEYHNLLKYKNEKLPKSVMIENILTAQYYGHKTMYYLNMHSKEDNKSQDGLDVDNEIMVEETKETCEGGACSI